MSDKQPVECCVCHERLEPPYNTLGGRVYCARHYAVLNKPHSGFWRASVVQIVGLGVFSALVAYGANFVGPLTGLPLALAGVLLAIIPSALWLIFFYQQDRLEPEPKHRVAAVFLLALLLADVLGRRVVEEWLRVGDWATASTQTSLLAAILVVGVTYQAIAYLSVRLLVYNTPEFDERMDGIVYGTVAGLGVATLLNLRFVLANGGVELGAGVIQTVTTSLAQASFAGLQGYFMAEAKFTHRPVWWVPLGFALAALLNGLFSWLIGEVSAVGLQVDPWRSLVLGLVVALVAFAVLVALMRRTTRVTLGGAGR